jgi:hypothetical protein
MQKLNFTKFEKFAQVVADLEKINLPKTTHEPLTTIHDSRHVVGINRDNARVWLQAKWLIDAGFSQGTVYNVEYGVNKIWITPSAKGRKVAGKVERPIIDLNSKKVTKAIAGASSVRVVAVKNKITISA